MIIYITELNENNYATFTSDGLILVFAFASWSGLSEVASPIVDEISSEYIDKIMIGKLDIEMYNPNIKFRDVPSFIIYKNGEVMSMLTGFENKEKLVEFFNPYL